jgi:hypothetical protein
MFKWSSPKGVINTAFFSQHPYTMRIPWIVIVNSIYFHTYQFHFPYYGYSMEIV